MGGVAKPYTDDLLVVCANGPKVNQWFYLADWEESVAAAERINDRKPPGSPRSAYLGYQLTDERIRHPDKLQAEAGVTGQVAVHPDYPRTRSSR